MVRRYRWSIILAGAILACAPTTPDETNEEPQNEPAAVSLHNVLSKQEKETGWELLFDGESTDKWRGYNHERFPDHGWEVRDGQIVVIKSGTEEEGFGGDIISKEKFVDFDLRLEFLLTDTANSGILYLVQEVEDMAIWYNAPEYQIIDNPTYEATLGFDWMNTHRTGDNYDLQAAAQDFSKPVGEWNRVRILKRGTHIEHWLNGNMTVSYELFSPEWEALVAKSKFAEYPGYARAEEGHIGIQDHGHEVMYRNIKVLRL